LAQAFYIQTKEARDSSGKIHFMSQSLLLVLVVFGVGSALVAVSLRPYAQEARVPGCALAAGVIGHHVEGLLYTYILSDSLVLCERVGQGAEFSGLLLGAHKMGTAAGSLALWCALRYRPECWRAGKLFFRFAVCLQVIGSALFSAVAHGATALHNDFSVPLLIFGRLVTGLGGGAIVFLTLMIIGKGLPIDQRPGWSVTFFLVGVSALGVGPLCAAVAVEFVTSLGCDPQEALSTILVVLPIFPLIQAQCWATYPDLQDATDFSQQTAQTNAHSIQTGVLAQSLVMACCVAMQALRNLTISSLEAGVTMLLESSYSWSSAATGFAVAVVISTVILANCAYSRIAGRISPYVLQHIMSCGILLGSLVIFLRHPIMLLVGTAVGIQASALSGGLIMAMLQKYALPEGLLFDLSKAMLMATVGCDFVGRGCGPAIARQLAAWGGQSCLASFQLCVSVGLFGLHEWSSRLASESNEDDEMQCEPEVLGAIVVGKHQPSDP